MQGDSLLKNQSESNFVRICRDISRVAKSREEAQKLINQLLEVDWNRILNQDRVECYHCRASICYADAFWTPFINIKTPQKPCCQSCQKEMLRQYTKSIGKICVICNQKFLTESGKDRAIICDPCKQLTHITETDLQKENITLLSHLQRAKGAQVSATLSLSQWVSTLNAFSWKCAYCQGDYEVMEHFIPIAHRGGTTQSNCVPSCKKCNIAKGQSLPDQIIGIPPKEITRVRTYLEQFS